VNDVKLYREITLKVMLASFEDSPEQVVLDVHDAINDKDYPLSNAYVACTLVESRDLTEVECDVALRDYD
jgi:hypothetical protein